LGFINPRWSGNQLKAIIDRLVVSIQEKRLVIFWGAGISLTDPSHVPSAAVLTGQCIAEYNSRGLAVLPLNATKNLETLTEHLFSQDLQSLFVRELVDWRPFRRNPNSQHVAIADLITTSAAQFGVTTNFDQLVEQSAMGLGEDNFLPALDLKGVNAPNDHRPLIKLHGCVLDRDHTLWCQHQLKSPAPITPANQLLRQRIYELSQWLGANLPEKDVLFVGFWTDWSYLNSVLAEHLNATHLPLVVLVDPQSSADLAKKAPELWDWAKSNVKFHHVQTTGQEFLRELRNAFSRNLLTRVLLQAVPGFQNTNPGIPTPSTEFDGLSTDDLHSVRRDVFGVPSTRIPRFMEPHISMDAVGRAHLMLRHGGAQPVGSRYVSLGGKRIRVINGSTKLMNLVKKEFSAEVSPVAGVDDDIVICAGAEEDAGTAISIFAGSPIATVVRPASTAEWVTLEAAVSRKLL
jgi:NAD-dependent SIR2 family protein deacetylase